MIETEGVSDKKLMNHETPNVLIGFVLQKPTRRPTPFVSAILFGAFHPSYRYTFPSSSSASSFLTSSSPATFTIKHVQKQKGVLRKEGVGMSDSFLGWEGLGGRRRIIGRKT
nr:hypothetical protein CFP56_60624 [Quercus suber]